MSFSESNRVRLSYIAEPNLGETPSVPEMQEMRITSSGFAADKQTVLSDELRADRMVSAMPEVGFESAGSCGIEWSLGGTFDELLEAALCGEYSEETDVSGIALTVVAASSSISDPLAGAPFAPTSVGDYIFLSGFSEAANNGFTKVLTKVDDDNITVTNTNMVDETSAVSAAISGKTLINGVQQRSFSFEQAFEDINSFQLFSGQRLGVMSVEAAANSIVTGTFEFTGTEVEADSNPFNGSLLSPTSTEVLNATSNVGQIVKDGVPLATAIQSISLNLDNALRVQQAVSNKFPVGIGYGRQVVSGSLSAYFENLDLYNAMLAHDDVALTFGFQDAEGNAMVIELPRIKFNTSAPAPSGIDTDVMEEIDWTAIADTNGEYQIKIGLV